jgi:hypothetical protein
MEEGQSAELLTFLPLEELEPVHRVLGDSPGVPDIAGAPCTLPEAESWFVFIEYLCYSHVYAIRLSSSPADTSPVLWICGPSYVTIANSLTEFVEAYLRDPNSILFPKDLPG